MRRPLMAWVLGASLALSLTAWAQDPPAEKKNTVKKEDVKTGTVTVGGKEYEVRPATPTYGGDTGLFHLSSAYTLAKGRVSFSLFRDNLDRDPKDVDASIHGLSLGIGATSRLEIFGNIGLQNRNDVDALFQPGYVNDYPYAGRQASSPGWQTGVGDVKLGLKFKALDDYLGDGVGLALKGYVKIGTADETKGLGTGKLSAGADLILSKHLGYVVDVHGSVGYQINSDPDSITVGATTIAAPDIGNAFKWGVGLNLPCCKIFQIQAEVTGHSYSGASFKQTNPVDLVVGPMIWIKPGLFIRPAISRNLNFDDRGLGSGSKSSTGRQISIGYHPGTVCRGVYVAPVRDVVPPAANKPPTVACEVDRSLLQPGETVRCRARGSDPDGDRLTYEWSASAGRITGTGAEVTYDSTGAAAGSTVTITVRASDGRGGTATSTCTVRIEAPKPAEVVRCESGGFPRNLSRLNNVDKACLDDTAARLRRDPRSRLIITGHADKSERYPEVIARKRAEEVKNYLVKERGIEESRISVRSAGAGKPVDPGTTPQARAKNRRVELVFVPEGAVAPEDDD